MNSKAFRFHPAAREEFRSEAAWYRVRSPRVAAEFRIAVSDSIHLIASAPQRWPKYLHGTRRYLLQRFPFSIVYLDNPDTLTIVAVAHGKRKPGYWRRRI